MPGHYLHRPPRPHRCVLPDDTREEIGTVWQCDDCESIWAVCDPIFSQRGWYRPPSSIFMRLMFGLEP